MEKLLSVSVAAYNVARTLEEALQPFANSAYRDKLDIIIVNDGSKDQTEEIAAVYAKKYPDVFRLINKENGGWGSTLNTGMEQARGKYFKQLDGDDYFSKENLDSYLAFLSSCNADLVYTTFVTFDDKTGAIFREVGRYGRNMLPEQRTVHLDELTDFVPAMHTLTVRTEILQRNPIHITEHCFYTDVEFVLKCCNFCTTISFYELPIYYYRLARSGQSMSLEGVRKHYKDHLKMLSAMLEYEKEQVNARSVKKLFRLRLTGVCEMQYKFFFAVGHNGRIKRELYDFDQMLKEKYPYYYKNAAGRVLLLLRKSHYFGYRPIAAIADWLYKKAKTGVYEGC